MNQAVWYIFYPSAPLTDPYARIWLAAAQHEGSLNFPGVNFGAVTIFTPQKKYDPDPNSPQELMTLAPFPAGVPTGAAVPEPSTLLLTMAGISGLAFYRRKSASR